jgi:hypothetical protein
VREPSVPDYALRAASPLPQALLDVYQEHFETAAGATPLVTHRGTVLRLLAEVRGQRDELDGLRAELSILRGERDNTRRISAGLSRENG